MRFRLTRKAAAGIALFCGFSFMMIGLAVFLASAVGRPRAGAVLAAVCVILGSLLAFAAVSLHRRSRYLFAASLVIQFGLLILLAALGLVQSPWTRWWPLAAVFSGTSLLPAGWHRFGRPRASFMVPAAGFLLLGGVFLIFSFRVVPQSFKAFFIAWWPLLLLLSGVVLTLASLSARGSGEPPGPARPDADDSTEDTGS
jgi:hypothetical protein